MGRIIAIDYGMKRTGLAVTDSLRIIANGLDTIETNNLLTFLENYFKTEKVDIIVLGLPKRLNNTDTHATQMVLDFKKVLETKFKDHKIEMLDERYTSKIAFNTMLAGGLKKSDRRDKSLIDKISATIILQDYLRTIA